MVRPRKDTTFSANRSSSVFASNRSSTGLHSHKSSNKSSSNAGKSSSSSNRQPTVEIKEKPTEVDDDFNSGFGRYLRSTEGAQMMIMFVLANSAVIILTMAWPNLKELYRSIKETLFEEEF